MQDFRKLAVWEKSHQLALGIYRATRSFPREEIYGLTSQIRRAATSIPTNLAKGCGRSRNTEFSYFAEIALGSASELEYLLILVHDIELMNDKEHEQFLNQTIEIKRMLAGLLKTLKADH